jgi:hypothetical protein
MAQPQQQQQQLPMPTGPFSPQQASPSPGGAQQFALPPNKRQRLSPNPPSQPGSPYVQSPYGMSPGATTPQSTHPSPHFANVQLPNVYNTPYSNGHTTPTLSLPQPNNHIPNPSHSNALNLPNQSQSQNQNQILNQSQSQSQYQATTNNYVMPPQGAGTMGPPSKPEKLKEDGIDPMDVLGGTGIDLREEEQYSFQLYNTSFNSQRSGASQPGTISSGHSFTQFPPGEERSFYGAGPANAAAEVPDTKSQEEYISKIADRVWHTAARDLAISRQRELDRPFLEIATVHKKMEKIARENGLMLNLDNGHMGTMKLPGHFQTPTVKVQSLAGPNGVIAATSGGFIPLDSLLVDQVALLSIAAKYRLRGLIEDATKLSRGRQATSHGIVPAEWADVAAPAQPPRAIVEGAPRSGWESAVSPSDVKRTAQLL